MYEIFAQNLALLRCFDCSKARHMTSTLAEYHAGVMDESYQWCQTFARRETTTGILIRRTPISYTDLFDTNELIIHSDM